MVGVKVEVEVEVDVEVGSRSRSMTAACCPGWASILQGRECTECLLMPRGVDPAEDPGSVTLSP